MMRINNKTQLLIAIVAVLSLILSIYNLEVEISSTTTTADGLVMEGNNHFDKGEYWEAVQKYGRALKLYAPDGNAWRFKGLALLNLAMSNESARITRDRAYSYAEGILDGWKSQPQNVNKDLLERASQSFKTAYMTNPEDLEALLYLAITELYLSNSPGADPVKRFDELITKVNNIGEPRPPEESMRDSARYGMAVAYEKLKQ